MKIVAGEVEIQVLSAFEDFLYEQDQKRPALRLRSDKALTCEESNALNGQAIALLDDNGVQMKTYEGYSVIHECTMTLVKETQAEQELAALDQKMQTMKLALEAAGIDVDVLMLEQERKTAQDIQEDTAQ